jgi:hypothetical protein
MLCIDDWPNKWVASPRFDGCARFRLFPKIDEPGQ